MTTTTASVSELAAAAAAVEPKLSAMLPARDEVEDFIALARMVAAEEATPVEVSAVLRSLLDLIDTRGVRHPELMTYVERIKGFAS